MKQALSWPASTLIALGVILFVDTVFTFDPSTGFWQEARLDVMWCTLWRWATFGCSAVLR